MDTEIVLIFVGLILCGAIIASPIAYALGRRSVWREVDEFEERSEILNAEVIQ